MIVDLETHWWGGGYKMPHIRPTRGGSSSSTANDVGTIDYNASKPSFWQMAQFANVQYWNWKITHSQEMKEQIRVQWRYIRSVYSDQELSSADKSVGIVNVSDDAAWELNYLMQVHEVLGDKQSLDDATILLPNILNRFADPYSPRVSYGHLQGSPYGILYATKTDDPNHQDRSSAYEIMIADSALQMYQQDHNSDYLDYAIGTYNWMKKYMRHSNPTFYYCELDLKPMAGGVQNSHYLKPIGSSHVRPERGRSYSYSGGTLAMAVAAARLYTITGQQEYLKEAQQIASDYVRPDCFGRPGNLLVNDRDAWTDGYWAPYFATEVPVLPGLDVTDSWRMAIRCTAMSIIAQRTADGYYGADWSGPEHGTWLKQAAHGGMALPNQIMTSSDSAAMVTAAEIVQLRSDQ